jgi:hypothetical protein
MPDTYLPVETLDNVVDYLRDTEDALRNCCLVSKSWIPRARKHLFADIRFPTAKSLESWKEMFPDPSTSPACYAKTLSIGCLQVVTAADAGAGGWIRSFSRVVHLEVGDEGSFPDESFSLTPFHGFSPTIKSIRVSLPTLLPSQTFNIALSFPLLEDLAVIMTSTDNGGDGFGEDEMPAVAQPSSPPMFTGSLELLLLERMEPFTCQLLSLPGGIHFRRLNLMWLYDEDLLTIMALVEACSHTLEFLDITWNLFGKPIRHLHPHRQLTSVHR